MSFPGVKDKRVDKQNRTTAQTVSQETGLVKNLFHLIPIQRDMVWAQVRMQKLALIISTSKGLISLVCNGQFVKLTAT